MAYPCRCSRGCTAAGQGRERRWGQGSQPRDASESYPTRTGPPRWRRRLARHRRDERCGPAAALKTPWTRASCPGTGGKGCAARAGGGPAQRREAAQCPDAPQGHVAPGDSDTAAPCAPQQALPLPAACPRRPRMSESRQGPAALGTLPPPLQTRGGRGWRSLSPLRGG